MKTVSLSGSPRENVGKKDAKKNRAMGKVPCVMYGSKEEQKQFTVEEKELVKFVWSPHVYLFKINLDGKEYDAVVQDLQFHPVSDRVMHVDFLQIFEDKTFIVSLPVEPVGSSPGIAKGGKLYKNRRKLKVKGLINEMPEKIKIDISKLDINDAIKVNDLDVGNLTFLDPASSTVIAIKSAKAMAAMGADMEPEEEEEEGEEGEEGAEGEEGEEAGAEGEGGSEGGEGESGSSEGESKE